MYQLTSTSSAISLRFTLKMSSALFVSCKVYEFGAEYLFKDRLCGPVVRVLDYRSGGLGPIPGTTRIKKKVVGLERSPLSFVSTTEELLDRIVAAPV
jgi:hypothetical protein